ncbi:MAG: hypothetical protein ACRD3E_19495 [Terriglobales bacterium]
MAATLTFAQATEFLPCKFGEARTIGHADGITVRTVTIDEPSGTIGATALIPDSPTPVAGIVFSHSAIQGNSRRVDLLDLARAMSLAGAASVVLDGTISWRTPNDQGRRPRHMMACAGQWLLLNAKLDTDRLALAGPMIPYGPQDVKCTPPENPCFAERVHLNFGSTGPAERVNTDIMLSDGGRHMAEFAQRKLKLREVRPEWLAEVDPQHR